MSKTTHQHLANRTSLYGVAFGFTLFLAVPLTALQANSDQTAKPEPETTKQQPAFKPLQVYQAEYKLKSDRYNISAKAKRSFTIDDKQMASIKQGASLFVASIEQESDFLMQPGTCKIKSHSYSYKRSVFGKKKHYRIEFDHDKNMFMENKDGDKKKHPIENPLFDELSYQEALRCQLKNTPNIEPGTQFSYKVRTKGRNKDYIFEVAGEELIETALGKINTLKLTRLRSSHGEDEENFIWFSKEHDYMLVKLKQEDEDDKLSLDITELEQ